MCIWYRRIPITVIHNTTQLMYHVYSVCTTISWIAFIKKTWKNCPVNLLCTHFRVPSYIYKFIRSICRNQKESAMDSVYGKQQRKLLMKMTMVAMVITIPRVSAKLHHVGGSSGWTQNVSYSEWSSQEQFYLHDWLRKY